MQYLTPKEYRKLKKMSRQDFWNRKERGTIPLVPRKVTRIEMMVPVEDTELEGVNPETWTA